MSNKEKYFDALNRIVNGNPKIVDENCKINNLNVSLEAGNKSNTIKNNANFSKIRVEIKKYQAKNVNNDKKIKIKLKHQIQILLNENIMLANSLENVENELKEQKNKLILLKN